MDKSYYNFALLLYNRQYNSNKMNYYFINKNNLKNNYIYYNNVFFYKSILFPQYYKPIRKS